MASASYASLFKTNEPPANVAGDTDKITSKQPLVREMTFSITRPLVRRECDEETFDAEYKAIRQWIDAEYTRKLRSFVSYCRFYFWSLHAKDYAEKCPHNLHTLAGKEYPNTWVQFFEYLANQHPTTAGLHFSWVIDGGPRSVFKDMTMCGPPGHYEFEYYFTVERLAQGDVKDALFGLFTVLYPDYEHEKFKFYFGIDWSPDARWRKDTHYSATAPVAVSDQKEEKAICQAAQQKQRSRWCDIVAGTAHGEPERGSGDTSPENRSVPTDERAGRGTGDAAAVPASIPGKAKKGRARGAVSRGRKPVSERAPVVPAAAAAAVQDSEDATWTVVKHKNK